MRMLLKVCPPVLGFLEWRMGFMKNGSLRRYRPKYGQQTSVLMVLRWDYIYSMTWCCKAHLGLTTFTNIYINPSACPFLLSNKISSTMISQITIATVSVACKCYIHSLSCNFSIEEVTNCDGIWEKRVNFHYVVCWCSDDWYRPLPVYKM